MCKPTGKKRGRPQVNCAYELSVNEIQTKEKSPSGFDVALREVAEWLFLELAGESGVSK